MAFNIHDWVPHILEHLNELNDAPVTKGTLSYAVTTKGGWEKWIQMTMYMHFYKYFKGENCVIQEESAYKKDGSGAIDNSKSTDFIVLDYETNISTNIEVKCMMCNKSGKKVDISSFKIKISEDINKIRQYSTLQENYIVAFFRSHDNEGDVISDSEMLHTLSDFAVKNNVKMCHCVSQKINSYGVDVDGIKNNLMIGCALFYVPMN